MYDNDRPTVGTDVSSDKVVDEGEKLEFEEQRNSARVTGARQPDQKPGGDATAFPRPVGVDEAIESQPDAVKDQHGDRHYCPECGKVAYVDEARALLQESARLRALRRPAVDEVHEHDHDAMRKRDEAAAAVGEGDPEATPPLSDSPVVTNADVTDDELDDDPTPRNTEPFGSPEPPETFR